MSTRAFVILISFLLCSLGAFAQGSLKGAVADADTGELLPGANVVATSKSGFSRGVTTNLMGEFTFPKLPAETYSVAVTYVGFTDTIIDDIVVEEGQETSITIELFAGVSLNPVVVSASKSREKVNEAPAAIEVIDPIEIRNTSTASAADLIKGAKSVDVAQQGIVSQTVVTRGFNNIFSGSLLVLTDNRIASIPSLRANALHFLQLTNDDIEQIEMVLGPGSALYGPNVNSGIMHLITRSPLTDQSTDVAVYGGEQSYFKVQARTAHKIGENVGFKISAQYLTAQDFRLDENNPYRLNEIASRNAYLATEGSPNFDPDRAARIGVRDYSVEKLAFDTRLDIKLNDDAQLIFSGGYNVASNIDLTGLGAGQAQNWSVYYGQARFLYKDFFAQAYLNGTDSGDTYIIPTGLPIIDKSQLVVGQLQHNYEVGKLQLTYGADYLLTTPRTNGTINGQYEDIDQVTEMGLYGQGKYAISNKLDFVASFRVDSHSELSDPVFSPRAGFVFKPKPNHTFRATYNRSFGTPSSNNLWLDLQAGFAATPFPTLGWQVRAQGVPSTGFNFLRDGNGPMWYTPFVPDQMNTPRSLTSQDNWDVLAPIIQAGAVSALSGFYQTATGGGLSAEAALAQALGDISRMDFSNPADIGLLLATLNTATSTFEPLTNRNNVTDIAQMRPTIYNTFEVGYKGIFNNKLLVSADVYLTQAYDFVGPLLVETPNVFMEQNDLLTFLQTQFTNAGLSPLAVNVVAAGLAGNLANVRQNGTGLPIGVVSPAESFHKDAMILTYRNFGEVSFFGVDFGFEYLLNDEFRFIGNYSYISDSEWLNLDGNPDLNIYLNAPQNKGSIGVGYNNRNNGISGTLRARYVQGFNIESGIYNTRNADGVLVPLDDYTLVDFNFGYEIPNFEGMRFNLQVTNLLNNAVPQFAGTPAIGRLAIAGLQYTF